MAEMQVEVLALTQTAIKAKRAAVKTITVAPNQVELSVRKNVRDSGPKAEQN